QPTAATPVRRPAPSCSGGRESGARALPAPRPERRAHRPVLARGRAPPAGHPPLRRVRSLGLVPPPALPGLRRVRAHVDTRQRPRSAVLVDGRAPRLPARLP